MAMRTHKIISTKYTQKKTNSPTQIWLEWKFHARWHSRWKRQPNTNMDSIEMPFRYVRDPVSAGKINNFSPSEILLTQTAHWAFNELLLSIIYRLTNIIDYDFMLIMASHQINLLFDLANLMFIFSTFGRVIQIICCICFKRFIFLLMVGSVLAVCFENLDDLSKTHRVDACTTHSKGSSKPKRRWKKETSNDVEMCQKIDKAYDIII